MRRVGVCAVCQIYNEEKASIVCTCFPAAVKLVVKHPLNTENLHNNNSWRPILLLEKDDGGRIIQKQIISPTCLKLTLIVRVFRTNAYPACASVCF